VDDAGSLDPGDAPVRERTMTVPADGLLLFHWYERPRNGPARDFLSTVTVEWNDDRVSVVLQQLYG
jgi:hypothetical protein